MQNILDNGLLQLIKSALTGKACPLPDTFDLATTTALAKAHNVLVMCYYGAINCGISPDTPDMATMFDLVCQCILVQSRQEQILSTIYQAFDRQHVDYLPLKGAILRDLYPAPEMRVMGDVDILIRQEQYPQIAQLMEESGFTPGDISPHEFKWYMDTLCVELHSHIISPRCTDLYPYWQDPWAKAIGGPSAHQYALSCEDNLLYLITHLAIHYRSGGIGLKHITDIWLYLQAYPAMDKNYLHAQLETLGLLTFYQHITHLLCVWFAGEKEDALTQTSMAYILGGGAFGTYSRNVVAQGVKAKAEGNTTKSARRRELRKLFFPSYSNMCRKYPALTSAPVFLPFFWLRRLLTFFSFDKNRMFKLKAGFRNLKAGRIDRYQQFLAQVGLSFDLHPSNTEVKQP